MDTPIPYPRYRALFATDHAPVSIRVLRSRNAPLVLCFLQESFKTGNYTPVLTGEKLVGLLANFLETWESDTDDTGDLNTLGTPVEERAAKLLKDWVREGYLTLYTDEQGTDQHTLTPELESALDWVQSLLLGKFARLMKTADARVHWGGDWPAFKDFPHFEV